MTYYFRLQNSDRELKEIKIKVSRFMDAVQRLQKNTDLFAKDILNPAGAIPKVEKLRAEARQLIRQLNNQLSGGQRMYAKSRAERPSTHFQGMYGNLKGHNRQLVKILSNLVVHLDLLIDLIKSTNNENARTTFALSEAIQQNMDQQKEYGTSFDYGDPLVLMLAIAALFKKWKKQ